MKTGIHIEGGPKGPHVPRLLTILEKIGLRATELGRDDVARAAVNALGELGGVRNVQITGASISDGVPKKRQGGLYIPDGAF